MTERRILNSLSPSMRQAHPKCGKTLTEQSHEKACNINSIMAKYQKTGLVTHINARQGQFIDATGPDFERASMLVAEVHSEFNDLPSAVRDALDHDPQRYLELVQTDEGLEQLRAILDPDTVEVVKDESVPPEPGSDGTKDGEAVESAVT